MDDDDGLNDFRRAMADVRPLSRARRVAPRNAAPPPVPAQRERDERAALAETIHGPLSIDDALESGEEPVYLRPGLAHSVLRRLRRGHWVVQDQIDLHGMNRAQAAVAVAEFLRGSRARNAFCVRIVHGKGLGSANREPILKHALRKLLPRRDDVLAFCQAPQAHGGSGAMLVLLKAAR